MTTGSAEKRLRSDAASACGGPRSALPSDFAGSLRHLDDSGFQRLLRAVAGKARRRGRPLVSEPALAAALESGKSATPPGMGRAKNCRCRFRRVRRGSFASHTKPASCRGQSPGSSVSRAHGCNSSSAGRKERRAERHHRSSAKTPSSPTAPRRTPRWRPGQCPGNRRYRSQRRHRWRAA